MAALWKRDFRFPAKPQLTPSWAGREERCLIHYLWVGEEIQDDADDNYSPPPLLPSSSSFSSSSLSSSSSSFPFPLPLRPLPFLLLLPHHSPVGQGEAEDMPEKSLAKVGTQASSHLIFADGRKWITFRGVLLEQVTYCIKMFCLARIPLSWSFG